MSGAGKNLILEWRLLRQAKLKLAGHLNYYAITDNGEMCRSFRDQVARLLYKWLNRQSQRRSYNWERFNDALAWVGWPRAKIRHCLSPMYRMLAPNES
jgi:RNA-directed DNA polymerase